MVRVIIQFPSLINYPVFMNHWYAGYLSNITFIYTNNVAKREHIQNSWSFGDRNTPCWTPKLFCDNTNPQITPRFGTQSLTSHLRTGLVLVHCLSSFCDIALEWMTTICSPHWFGDGLMQSRNKPSLGPLLARVRQTIRRCVLWAVYNIVGCCYNMVLYNTILNSTMCWETWNIDQT